MRARRGVTLVEIAIVVAIIGILASIGAGLLTETIPSWRTRRAALDFAAAVNQARAMAIADNVQYRVALVTTDPDPTTGTANYGEYLVQRGNAASGSSAWDTLPVDMGGTDTLMGEGYVNIARGEEDSLPWVSLAEPDSAIAGVDGNSNSLVFNPRGQLDNPATDFACDIDNSGSVDGYICVSFVNKKAAQDGTEDRWTVVVSRAGMARLQHGDSSVGYASGASATSSPGSSSSGYSGGSSGSAPPT